MSEYPRHIEGGAVIELFPGAFYACRLDDPAIYDEGARLGFADFEQAAETAAIHPSNAGRAFNSIYRSLRQSARENGAIDDSLYRKPSQYEYLRDAYYGEYANTVLRRSTLLATQAIHDSYMEHLAQHRRKTPSLQEHVLIEALLDLGTIREPDEFFSQPVELEEE